MHDVDRRLGWAAFSLTYNLKGVFAVSSEDVYVPSVLGYTPNGSPDGGEAMATVSVLTFSEFCIAARKQRENIVENFANPKYGPPNAAERGMFQRTHWKTGDINTLVNAEPNVDKSSDHYDRVVANAAALKKHYLAFWRSRGASFFQVPRVEVPVGNLVVRVNPEVGMLTADGAQALKVWLGVNKMRTRRSEVCHYLFGEATKRPLWPGWPIGLWDVRREAIPMPPTLPDDMALTVAEAAAEFIRLLDLVAMPPSAPSSGARLAPPSPGGQAR